MVFLDVDVSTHVAHVVGVVCTFTTAKDKNNNNNNSGGGEPSFSRRFDASTDVSVDVDAVVNGEVAKAKAVWRDVLGEMTRKEGRR